jgi:hypothetical protein
MRMADLYLHGRELKSIFELLGSNENGITYSVGWALSQYPVFCKAIVRKAFADDRYPNAHTIRLQEFEHDKGITDIEILGDGYHIIVEAKRGWALPGLDQLRLYAPRLKSSGQTRKLLLVMAECLPEYAARHLPAKVDSIPVVFLSWKQVHDLSRTRGGSNAEKRLLRQLRSYL